LQLGDQNNSFFYRSLKVQQAKNTITHLWDEQGQKVEDVQQIKLVAKNFYKKLLGTNQMTFNEAKVARVRQLIPRVISADKAVLLEKRLQKKKLETPFFI
jgi:hypothetical protein